APPASIVLISGDIDYIQKLADLRYGKGYHITLLHTPNAKEELKKTANAAHEWSQFLKGCRDNKRSKPIITIEKQTNVSKQKVITCPSGHKLINGQHHEKGFTCNSCYTSRDDRSWYCKQCDYDLCFSCYNAAKKSTSKPKVKETKTVKKGTPHR